MQQDTGQKNMLENIGEIAGMEFVAIVHAFSRAASAEIQRLSAFGVFVRFADMRLRQEDYPSRCEAYNAGGTDISCARQPRRLTSGQA
jgi:hypothetical protein